MGKYLHLKDEAVAHHLSNPKNSISESAREFCKLNNLEYSDSFRKRLSEWVNIKIPVDITQPKLRGNIISKLGLNSPLGRNPLAEEARKNAEDFDNETLTDTNQYNSEKGLSALREDGTLMDIDEYCTSYGIPRAHVKSYKLLTYLNPPCYNIASHNLLDENGLSIDEKIEKMIVEYTVPQLPLPKLEDYNQDTVICSLTFSDAHVGMHPNKEGKSLYGGHWSKKDLFERRDVMLQSLKHITDNITQDIIINVINLGDFCDGLDGFTVKRLHPLEQNMSNYEVLDTGVEFMVSIYNFIESNIKCKSILWFNCNNSNHSSFMDYAVCQAFKGIILSRTTKIPTQIINERAFMGHVQQGIHYDIFCHAKDEKLMKFGMKATVDPKSKEKVEQYIKFHNIPNDANVNFHKGDNHLYAVDKTEDFGYNSYLALSPSSEYVQINFKSGRSGFTIIEKELNSFKTRINNFEFQWNSNKLK